MTRKRNRKGAKTVDSFNKSGVNNRMWKRAKLPHIDEEDTVEDEQVTRLFSKKLTYVSIKDEQRRSVEDWIGVDPQFPALETHRDVKLMQLKQEVNEVKDQLSSKDIETWHAHTTRCNLAAAVIPYVKTLEVELCTQAWVKFYEILSEHHSRGLVPNQPFLSLHLCEAPGAFITALNHFLQSHGFPHTWDWRATTLNPYHEANNLGEMIADDRLIRQTYSQWYFGVDGSGDITVPGHITGLSRMIYNTAEEEELKVLLVTADGSKDCQENPAEQEALVSRLHYSEALTAALVLAPGGALVIKMFTLYERSSAVLVFLLNVMFEEVTAMKPATSKSGNSEVYLVCVGYRNNIQEQTLWKLLDLTVYKYPDGGSLDLIQALPQGFVEEHRCFCSSFAQWQLETIRFNLQLYDNQNDTEMQKLEDKQQLALKRFLRVTGLTRKERHHRRVAGFSRDKSSFYFPLPPQSQQDFHHCHHGQHQHNYYQPQQHHRQSGTFQNRQNMAKLSWSERLDQVEVRDDSKPRLQSMQCKHFPEDSEVDEWAELSTGQAYSIIHCSRFCDNSLLADVNLIMDRSDYERCRQWSYKEHAHWLGQAAASLLLSNLEPSSISPPPSLASSYSSRNKHFPPVLSSSSGDAHFPPLPSSSLPLSKSLPSALPTPAWHLPQEQRASQVLYWDRGRGEGEERDSPMYDAFIKEVADPKEVKVVDDDSGVAMETSMPGRVFCNLTSFCDTCWKGSWNSRFEELACRGKMVTRVVGLLKNLSAGSRLVLLTPTFLCRLSSTLLYVLARLFRSIHIESSPNLWLHQLITLEGFVGEVSPSLMEHLIEVAQRMEQEMTSGQVEGCVMEVLSFHSMVSDRKFVQFVTAHNNRSMAGFVNIMLQHCKTPPS